MSTAASSGLAKATAKRRVGLHDLRADSGLYLRLLGVALPLTIALGTALALAGTTSGWRCWSGRRWRRPTPRPSPGSRSVRPAAGARLDWATNILMAWFGPRGLASMVFALLALEELGRPTAGPAVAVITITVVLSIVAHGATAEPLATRYANRLGRLAAGGSEAQLPDVPDRGLIRHKARRGITPHG